MSRHSHLTPFFPNSPIHSGFPFSPRAAPYVVGSLEHLAYARATIQGIKRLAGPITFLVYRIWNKGQKVLKTLLIHSYSFFNIFFPTFVIFLLFFHKFETFDVKMLHYRLYFWIYIVRSLSRWRIYRMFIVRKRWHPIHGARVKRKETVLHGLERKRRISARVVMSYAAGSRQVVEWNRYLLGKIITVLFLSSVLPSPFLFSLSLFIVRRQ